MNAKKLFVILFMLIAVMALSSCTKAATTATPETRIVYQTVEVPVEVEKIVEVLVTPTPAAVVNETPTLEVEETRAVADAEALAFEADGPYPVLHHADSHAPEEGVGSFDIGVEPGQVGLVFGVHIFWPAGNLDAGGDGCDFVVLNPGFYPDLAIEDGRYEVYTLPERDHDGWITSLVELRAEEQAAHYECPTGTDHIRVWNADPFEETWAGRRRASGEDYLIQFAAGDKVYGFSIYLGEVTYTEGVGHTGELVCDGGGCYYPSAPEGGWCGGCVVNTWWDEIPSGAKPLDPTK